MDWILENPRKGLRKAHIDSTFGGKYFLYADWDWKTKSEPVDGYMFPSDSAAKRYFSTHYQSVRLGHEKPKWIERIN